ncbi:hypothetical protein BGZ88_007419 [Linnemannia elongata]|nr:hypothetical protein BGZ88_007419 [Linnemannia elongata]
MDINREVQFLKLSAPPRLLPPQLVDVQMLQCFSVLDNSCDKTVLGTAHGNSQFAQSIWSAMSDLEAHEAWTAPDKYREVMVDRVKVRIYFYGLESRQHQFLTCSIVRSNSPTAVFAARVVP